MNLFGKLCLQIDSRDDMASAEALAMAGADYATVQNPFIDQPWIRKLEQIFERIWPFGRKKKVGDYERESKKRRIIGAMGRRSRLKVIMEDQKIVKSNANKGTLSKKFYREIHRSSFLDVNPGIESPVGQCRLRQRRQYPGSNFQDQLCHSTGSNLQDVYAHYPNSLIIRLSPKKPWII